MFRGLTQRPSLRKAGVREGNKSVPENPSDSLCAFVADTQFAALPQTTRHAAKRVLLDATGVIMGASGMVDCTQPFIELACQSGEGRSAILGTGHRVPASAGAFANGALAHALDFEDTFELSPGHPNASLVPALIAVAQSHGPVSGEQFLTALAVGCDISCRMALALEQRLEVNGWYPPPILAGFGAAAGAASLLGLTASQVRDALSLTLCQVTMPGEIKHSAITQIRAVREAFPAQAAIQSALLARAGVIGVEQPLEGKSGFYALYAGRHWSAQTLLDRIGEHFWIESLTFKPWPSCRGTHAYIQMAMDLQRQHGFSADDVEEVTASISAHMPMLFEPEESRRRPSSAIEGKFSIPYTLGLALVRGHVSLDDFGPEDLRDPELLALAAKVQADLKPEGQRPPESGGELTIRLKSGETHHAAIENAIGSNSAPLSDEQLIDKFVDCTGRARQPLRPAAAKDLANAILSAEDCPDIGALFL